MLFILPVLYFTLTLYLTQPTQEPVPAEVANEPAYMGNYLPTTRSTVDASDAHNDPSDTTSTVDTDNSYNGPPATSPAVSVDFTTTHSNPFSGVVTGDHKDVS